jgi:hypothetical protein
MNTAAKMESTGLKGRIQISQDTAECLREHGKEIWFVPRNDVKGRSSGVGDVQTYWLCLGNESDFGQNGTGIHSERGDDHTHVSTIELVDDQKSHSISSEKISRLIDWNVDTLLRLLKRVVAFRKAQGKSAFRSAGAAPFETNFGAAGLTSVVNEVTEIINLPQVDAKGNLTESAVDSVTLPPEVVEQLYTFVASIAALYNANPFHSFEHASHVTMSVVKLLSRIIAPNRIDMIGKTLHDHTYGITSDPLTQFACVFSALIHDGKFNRATEDATLWLPVACLDSEAFSRNFFSRLNANTHRDDTSRSRQSTTPVSRMRSSSKKTRRCPSSTTIRVPLNRTALTCHGSS